MSCRGNSCPQNNSRRCRFMRASAMHRQPFRLLLRKIHPPLHREGKYSLAPLCKRSWRRSRLRGCSCVCGDRPRRPVKLRNGRIISAPTNRCRESKGLPPDVGKVPQRQRRRMRSTRRKAPAFRGSKTDGQCPSLPKIRLSRVYSYRSFETGI